MTITTIIYLVAALGLGASIFLTKKGSKWGKVALTVPCGCGALLFSHMALTTDKPTLFMGAFVFVAVGLVFAFAGIQDE